MFRLAAALVLAFVSSAAVKVGQTPPEIVLDVLLPEQPVANASLASLKGKAIVLEFWATWCGPCVGGIAHWNQLAGQYKDKPLVFLAVAPQSREEVDPVLKKWPRQGLSGLAKDTKLAEAYGVIGVPRTFLIGADGKLAADVGSRQLTAAMLDSLLANRPVVLPETESFTAQLRGDDPSAAAPVVDAIIRPTSALDRRGGQGIDKDNIMFRGATIPRMLTALYGMMPNRILADPPLDTTSRYDVSISLPGASREAFRAFARQVICSAFHVSAELERRDTDVFVLGAPDGKPAGITKSPDVPVIRSNSGKGRLKVTGPATSFALSVSLQLGKPVIDESNLPGAYEFDLRWQDGEPGAIEKAVESLGFKLTPARRPVEFLVVRKTP